MANTQLTIQDGMAVGIHYVVMLDDGQVVDASDEQEPLWFLQGAGQIVPGLEKQLYGMALGDSKRVVVEPEDAYGEYDEEEEQFVENAMLPDDWEPEPGMELVLQDDDTGEVLQAYITEIEEDGVWVDFNHPLAGEQLTFDVRVVGLRRATREELAHGHVH